MTSTLDEAFRDSPSRREGRRGPFAYQGRVDASTPAVVLKLAAGRLHQGGLGAIRSLGRLGVPVYAVPSRWWEPAAGSRYVRGGLPQQPDPGQVDQTVSALRGLAERIGRPAVVIPTDEAGAVFLAEHGGPLRDCFLFPEPPPGVPRMLADKSSLHALCRQTGIPSPRSTVPASLEEAREFAAEVGFPVLAKLMTPWTTPKVFSVVVIADPGQLAEVYQARQSAGAGLMLQERIPGTPGSDWIFTGYCAGDSGCHPAFTAVKHRTYPADSGPTCLCYGAQNDELRELASRLLAKVSYRGIIDLDFRWDARTGEYLLLDANPRLGAQARVCQDLAGLDVALAAYLDLTGQELTVAEQAYGHRLLVEHNDLVWALGSRRDSDFSWKGWLRSAREAEETAWFARDDLWPAGLESFRMGGLGVKHFATRATRRVRGRGDTPGYADPAGPAGGARRSRARATSPARLIGEPARVLAPDAER